MRPITSERSLRGPKPTVMASRVFSPVRRPSEPVQRSNVPARVGRYMQALDLRSLAVADPRVRPISADSLGMRAKQLRGAEPLAERTIWRDLWCPGTESNRRHEDFQSSALPTELPGREPLEERRARYQPEHHARKRCSKRLRGRIIPEVGG